MSVVFVDDARYVLIDVWKTHFGAPQNYPAICQVRENRYYPIWYLESTPIVVDNPTTNNNDDDNPTTTSTTATTATNSSVKKAVDTAKSLYSVRWCRFSGDTPAVRPVLDENASVLELGTDAENTLQFVTSSTESSDDKKYFDHVDQLVIEKIKPHHLIGCVLLEYELFGGEHSFVADFASGAAEGFCAVDKVCSSRSQYKQTNTRIKNNIHIESKSSRWSYDL